MISYEDPVLDVRHISLFISIHDGIQGEEHHQTVSMGSREPK